MYSTRVMSGKYGGIVNLIFVLLIYSLRSVIEAEDIVACDD